MGEVGGSFILGVFQTHIQATDANSSVHLAEAEISKHQMSCDLTNLRAASLPLHFTVHLTEPIQLPQNMNQTTKYWQRLAQTFPQHIKHYERQHVVRM